MVNVTNKDVLLITLWHQCHLWISKNRDKCQSRCIGIGILMSLSCRGNRFRDECLMRRLCNVIIVTWFQKTWWMSSRSILWRHVLFLCMKSVMYVIGDACVMSHWHHLHPSLTIDCNECHKGSFSVKIDVIDNINRDECLRWRFCKKNYKIPSMTCVVNTVVIFTAYRQFTCV